MPFGAVASAIGGIGALASVGSSLAGAGTAAASGAAEASDIEQGQQQANALLSPFATTGATANNQLADLTGIDGTPAQDKAFSTFQASPGYAYQKAQGLTAIDQGAASKGMLQSGATVQAEETFGSNLADQSFTQYYNELAGLAGTGLKAADSEAQTDTSTAASLAGITNGEATGINSSVQSGVNSLYQLGTGTTGVNPVSAATAAATPGTFGTGVGDIANTSAASAVTGV